MKVVFDVNVFISGILWHGICNKLIKLAEDKRFVICTTPQILDELKSVLHRPKFALRKKTLNTSVEELIMLVTRLVQIFPDIKIPPVVVADFDDNKFIACAEISNSKFIVTGDKHLLNLKSFRNMSIVTPQIFLKILE